MREEGTNLSVAQMLEDRPSSVEIGPPKEQNHCWNYTKKALFFGAGVLASGFTGFGIWGKVSTTATETFDTLASLSGLPPSVLPVMMISIGALSLFVLSVILVYHYSNPKQTEDNPYSDHPPAAPPWL